MEKTSKSAGVSSSTLSQGLEVLEFTALAGKKKGINLQEISKSLGMGRSKVYRYLKTSRRLRLAGL